MFEPEPFGRYELLERIAVGGMAEIFRAKSRSLAGFEKVLAIKRLHPRYGEDVDFIKMLIEEARICVQLAHVNIVQIFDLDKIEDHYFIAMEFMDGRDLYRVLRRMNERDRLMPIECAAWVASEILNGLDYAHRKNDESGQPMEIVHRDISPQNVLLSWEGEVKIIDFGIAKATQRSFETESGVVKGKFYYMSPEQARGERVDHRSDLFSAAIVLYEMLTGTLMYKEEQEAPLLSRVRKAAIESPIRLRPEIPHELERIVMRGLQRDARRRYQTGREFGDALRKFLYASGLQWGRADVAQMVGGLFDQPYRAEPASTSESTIEDVAGLANLAAGRAPSGVQALDPVEMQREEYEVESSSMLYRFPPPDDEDEVPTRSRDDAVAPAPPDPFGTGVGEFTEELSLEDVSEVLATGGASGLPVRSEGDEPMQLTGEEEEVTTDLDDDLDDEELEDEPTGIFDGRRHSEPEKPAFAAGPAAPIIDRTQPPAADPQGAPRARPSPAAKPAAPQPSAQPAAGQKAVATIAAPPPGASLEIPLAGERTSISKVEIRAVPLGSLDRRHKLAYLAFLFPVVLTGWGISWCNQVIANRPTSVTVSAGSNATVTATPVAAVSPTGKAIRGVVEVLSNPKGAVIEVDGKVLAERTPTTLRTLRAEEEHKIALTLNNHEPWERRFRLALGETRTLQADLARIEGTLEVNSSPSGARVEIDGQPRGETPLEAAGLFIGEEQEIVLRKAGFRPVTKRVEWNGRRFVTLNVELKSDGSGVAVAVSSKSKARSSAGSSRARTRRAKAKSKKAARRRSGGRGESHGYLSVSAIPWGKVYVDRRIYAAETPVLRGRVPLGRHSVKVYYPTLKRFSEAQTVTVRAGETKKLFFRD